MYDDSQPLVAVRIKDGIFCGNVTAAYDEDFLIMNKVTHIVNCAGGETKDLYKHSGIQYINFPWSLPTSNTSACTLFDSADKNIESVVRFVDETLAQGECILIQSLHGRSRACAVIAAYFIAKYRWTLDHALDFIAMAHEDMDILPQFKKQLEIFYQRHEVPASVTGRALDVFHPEVDDSNFAMDNEQWMLRNTYVNGLISESQEKNDLFKVATARVQLAEPAPKSAAKRRRRLTFSDTKQGSSVACMWTQPVVQHRQTPQAIRPPPPNELGPSIVARPATPHNHRIDGDAHAHVHTATHLSSVGSHGRDSDRGHVIKLQLRADIDKKSGSGLSGGLVLGRDSPVIGSGPALVVAGGGGASGGGAGGGGGPMSGMQRTQISQQQQQQRDENKHDIADGGMYNQAVSRVLPAQRAEQQDQYSSNNSYGYGQKQQSSSQQQYQQQNQTSSGVVRVNGAQPQSISSNSTSNAPSAANIAASLGTTGQGNLITLRGGAPMSISAGMKPTATTTTSSGAPATQQQRNATNSPMRPIPDASSGIRTYGGGASGVGSGSSASASTAGARTTTTPRPGPVVTGGGGGLSAHSRSNPFTLPSSGRTVHRGSPLPMQRQPGGGTTTTGSRLTGGGGGGGAVRTNSPIRNNNTATTSSHSTTFGSAFGASGGSPIRRANSPTTQSSQIGFRNTPTRGSAGGPTTTSGGGGAGGTSSYLFGQQQQSRVSSQPVRANSPMKQSGSSFGAGAVAGSSPGARPSSPGRNNLPTSAGAPSGSSMIGSSGWSSSLLPTSHGGGGVGSSSSLLRPTRTGSPLVRSNSPTSMRTNNNIPSANTGVSSLVGQPPSRPAAVSAQLSSMPSSHIPRTSSPLARRTNSPTRGPAVGGTTSTFGSSSFLSGGGVRGNSPNTAAARGGGGGGSLAEQFLMRNPGGGTSMGGRNSPMLRR